MYNTFFILSYLICLMENMIKYLFFLITMIKYLSYKKIKVHIRQEAERCAVLTKG